MSRRSTIVGRPAMVGTFACPECGAEVSPKGYGPGRQVRCKRCDTLVEVPFFRRSSRPAGRGRRRHRRHAMLWTLAAAGGLALLVLGGFSWLRGHERAEVRDQLASLLSSSHRLAESGRYDRALNDVEAALELAARHNQAIPDDLRHWRDDLSVRDTQQRLEGVGELEPKAAVGECLTLLDRANRDPALRSLKAHVLEQLRIERERRARDLLDQADSNARAGLAASALGEAAEALRVARELPLDEKAQRLRLQATELAGQVIAAQGVVIEPIRGQFTNGTPYQYDQAIRPILVEALHQHGYVLESDHPTWSELWPEHASRRLVVKVAEFQDLPYAQSALRATRIEMGVTLSEPGVAGWHCQLNARTRVPPPSLSRLEASEFGIASHRDPDAERILYEDARTALAEGLALRLRSLPPSSPGRARTSRSPS